MRSFALYGDTTGETDEYGLPVRYPWAERLPRRAMVLYGHTPMPEPEWVNNTLCLDTGCVFGGQLTALRYPENASSSPSPAEQVWYEPVKPFPPRQAVATGRAADRARHHRRARQARSSRPRHHGRVTIREENAAGALEVMSRFALHPRLAAVPAADDGAGRDVAPCRTCSSTPTRRSRRTATRGVAAVVCEEKHMGSRAVVLVCRDAAAATPIRRTGGEPAPSTPAPDGRSSHRR